MRYVDTSALAKLVLEESDSPALRQHLQSARTSPLVASMIARTEVALAITRTGRAVNHVLADEPAVLHIKGVQVLLADVTADIARLAGSLGADLSLRTLDAIHVATAAGLRPSLTELITYDMRMIEACRTLGIHTASPM